MPQSIGPLFAAGNANMLNDTRTPITSFTIEGRSAPYPDIQRNFMWQLVFANTIPGSDPIAINDLIVKCRSVSMPGRSIEQITSYFMGTRQFHAGKALPGGGTVTADFEETEGLGAYQIFYNWFQEIFSINRGYGNRHRKVGGYAVPMYLVLTTYDGKYSGAIKFHNVWIQNMSDVNLNYNSNEAVRYSITFQYDFWNPAIQSLFDVG